MHGLVLYRGSQQEEDLPSSLARESQSWELNKCLLALKLSRGGRGSRESQAVHVYTLGSDLGLHGPCSKFDKASLFLSLKPGNLGNSPHR